MLIFGLLWAKVDPLRTSSAAPFLTVRRVRSGMYAYVLAGVRGRGIIADMKSATRNVPSVCLRQALEAY